MDCIFYVMRHGLTKDDMPGRDKVTGWLEVPLNAEGKSNVAKSAKFLKQKGISHIVSSDLKRTRQSADIVSNELGLKVVESEKLRSWNMGSMEGMLAEAAKPFLTYFQKHPELTPPNGEPFERFYTRFRGAFYSMVSYVRKFPNSRPLIVTHSQNMDIIEWFLKDIGPGRALEFGNGIEPGGVMEISITESGIKARKLRVR